MASATKHFIGRLVPAAIIAMSATLSAQALEYPIGTPKQRAGMEIAAVYLQPVVMEPDGMMKKAEESDIHIEADIHALAGNPNGFEEGAWVPYLVVRFEVSKEGGTQKVSGLLMPMVANDGPHYGDNIKLSGPGKYHVKYTILPPSENQHAHFGRHTDRLTGVRPWFKPFDVEFDFTYVGIGKKGGY
jgi:periplasmic iron binding protein